jgi:hypothetical protein
MLTIHVCPLTEVGALVYGGNLRGFAMASSWKCTVMPKQKVGQGVGNDCLDQTGCVPSALH